MTRISQVVLFVLLNAMWQVTLIASVVSLSDRLLRKVRARYRHLLWVAALGACFALTLGSLLRAWLWTSVITQKRPYKNT